MSYEEIIAKMDDFNIGLSNGFGDVKTLVSFNNALRAIVELHEPIDNYTGKACGYCFQQAYEPSGLEMIDKDFAYPCATIKAIEKEING